MSKFYDFLLYRRLFFAKPKGFADVFEGRPNLLMQTIGFSPESMHHDLHSINANAVDLNSDNIFILCCRKEEIELDEMLLMWDMYTQKSDFAVKIVFHQENFIREAESYFKEHNCELTHKGINYNNNRLNNISCPKELFFRKNINYQFEQEYRFLVQKNIDSCLGVRFWEKNEQTLEIVENRYLDHKNKNYLINNNIEHIKFIQNNRMHFVANNEFNGEISNGCYMPINIECISHIVITPYANTNNENTIFYLAKTILFPELIDYTSLSEMSNEEQKNNKSVRIRTSTCKEMVHDMSGAISIYD